jgi:hypothetical protein
MVRSLPFVALLTAQAILIAGFASSAVADNDHRAAEYQVTVTNLTKGQVFSPPVLATHKSSVAIFAAGDPASDELVDVAENGMGGALADYLNSIPQVFEAIASTQPVPPAMAPFEPVTFEISSRGHFDRLSMVSMLVNTNDAFLAIDTVRLPKRRGKSLTYYAIAYDAGSENNNQLCAYVPGPACEELDSGNSRDESEAEGVVYVHNGVHETGELSPAKYDWHNPVAKVVITRSR